jgi:hypothetical protein
VSTHSPQVLDLVWVLQTLGEARAAPEELLRVLAAPKTQGLAHVAGAALKKTCKVYYFDGENGNVHDITHLDPAAVDQTEASWGGMLEFSGRANEAVATAKAKAEMLFES